MNKILLTGIISILFLVGSSSIIFAQEHSSPETIDHEENEYNLEVIVVGGGTPGRPATPC